MGKAKKPKPVKLVIALIYQKEGAFDKARALLEKEFGKIDYESPALRFTHTGYYAAELGRSLKRKFVSFAKLIHPHSLASIKAATNTMEEKLSARGLRLINIDPGYLNMAKFILATTKDYVHRIYLDKGIYAEITLFYRGKSFTPWDWTYPDYRSPGYISTLNRIRQLYARQNEDK